MMLKQVFIFGVVIPTLITVFLFIGFLVCWFKFNMRERLQKAGFLKRPIKKTPPSREVPPIPAVVTYRHGDHMEDPPSDGSPSNHPPPPPREPSHTLTRIPRTTQVANGHIQGSPTEHNSSEDLPRDLRENQANHRKDYFMNPMAIHQLEQGALVLQPHTPHRSTSSEQIKNVAYLPGKSPLRNEDTFLEGAGSDDQGLVQQVFHFPHSDSEGYKIGRHLEEEDSNSDYGHFVPVSELIKDPKLREHYQKAFIQNSANEYTNGLGLEGSLVYANNNTQCSQECLDTVGKAGFGVNHIDSHVLQV